MEIDPRWETGEGVYQAFLPGFCRERWVVIQPPLPSNYTPQCVCVWGGHGGGQGGKIGPSSYLGVAVAHLHAILLQGA